MYDDIEPLGQQNSPNTNRADWAQDSPSGTVTEFSEPHFHNDGSYGFDSYEYDTAGNQVDRTDDHQLNGTGQRSLRDYGVDQQPQIGGKLDQQATNQYGEVDGYQQGLNQF